MPKLPTHSIRLRINAISAAATLLILALALTIIFISVGNGQSLEINGLRTKISDDINELSALRGMDRGLGVAILSGEKGLLPQQEAAFKDSQDYYIDLKENIEQFKAISNMGDDFDTIVTLWDEQYNNQIAARSRLHSATISNAEWFEVMTNLIYYELVIRDMLFKPINNEEAIFYHNSILRPSLSLLTEYAGRERALLASPITQKQPISLQTKMKLAEIHGEIDRIILQLNLLKRSPSLSPALLANINDFEEEFKKNYRSLIDQIYAVSLEAELLQEDHEHTLDHLTESYSVSMQNSVGNTLSIDPKDIVVVDSQGFYLNSDTLSRQRAQTGVFLNIKDRLGAISDEILSTISGTTFQYGKIISYHRVNYDRTDSSKYIVLIKSSTMPDYPVTGKEWLDRAALAINSALKISRTAGNIVTAAEKNSRKTAFRIYVIEALVVVLTFVFLMVTVIAGRRISSRLESISKALSQLASGKLSTRIKTNINLTQHPDRKLDELDELVVNINLMAQKLEEMVTNISLAEASAQAANISKSQFLSNMSHEIRTPLNAIIGFSSIIKDELFGALNNEKYKEYIEDIEISGHHLLELINDLLDISSIEAGKMQMDPSAVNIEDEIETCCNLTKSLTKAKSLTVTNDPLEDSNAEIFVDPRRFRQIMLNILSNAIKYTPNNGAITFRKDFIEDDHIKIVITDTGVGMNTATLKNIFKAYSRSEDAYSKKQEGTGLGLHLTQELIRALGGEMHIDSELGVGTAVILIFPLYRDDK